MRLVRLLLISALFSCGQGEKRQKKQNGITFQRYRKKHSRLMQDIRDIDNEPPSLVSDLPEEFFSNGEKAQAMYDKMLNIIKTGVNADVTYGFFTGEKWDELFTNPRYTQLLLKSAPVLNMISGISEYMNKNLTVLEAQDVGNILRNFGNITMTALTRDKKNTMDAIATYKQSSDPHIRKLLAQGEAGNYTAQVLLQQTYINEFLGGVVNLFKLGANLVEPDWMREQREMFLSYPWVQQVLDDEPELKKYATDPMQASIDILKQSMTEDAFKQLL